MRAVRAVRTDATGTRGPAVAEWDIQVDMGKPMSAWDRDDRPWSWTDWFIPICLFIVWLVWYFDIH